MLRYCVWKFKGGTSTKKVNKGQNMAMSYMRVK